MKRKSNMVFLPRPITTTRRQCQRYLLSVTLLALPLQSCGFVSHSLSSSSVVSPPHPMSLESHQVMVNNNEGSPPDFRRRWRRAFRRVGDKGEQQRPRKDSVFGLSQKEDKVTMKGRTAMKMSSTSVLEEQVQTVYAMDSMLLHDYERLKPSDVLPMLTSDDISTPLSLNQFQDYGAVDDDETDYSLENALREEIRISLEQQRQQQQGNANPATSHPKPPHRVAVVHKMVKGYLEAFVGNLFHRWSVEAPGSLMVQVQPEQLSQLLLRGKLKADAKVSFSHLKTAPIQLSSGVIEAKRLALNIWSFIGLGNNHSNANNNSAKLRYPSQFDFHFTDLCFSGEDLMQSMSIRNGLQRLLTRILERAGLVAYNQVTVTSIRILPNGKIACSGEASTPFSGQMISFEVRSGIGLSGRGHVVTFPGLEVSLQPSLGVFMPVYPEIDLDIGHNARLLSVDINGFLKTLSFSAKATVTPEHTLKLKEYLQTKESLGAQYTFDVGQWLTKLGNFTR